LREARSHVRAVLTDQLFEVAHACRLYLSRRGWSWSFKMATRCDRSGGGRRGARAGGRSGVARPEPCASGSSTPLGRLHGSRSSSSRCRCIRGDVPRGTPSPSHPLRRMPRDRRARPRDILLDRRPYRPRSSTRPTAPARSAPPRNRWRTRSRSFSSPTLVGGRRCLELALHAARGEAGHEVALHVIEERHHGDRHDDRSSGETLPLRAVGADEPL
jgi:hypothetical protein